MLRYYMFLLGLISATQTRADGDDSRVTNVTGTVGGKVLLHCSLNVTVLWIYYQKTITAGNEIFINGYSSREVLKVNEEYKNRSLCIVKPHHATLELSQLSLADEGEYSCIVINKNLHVSRVMKYHLTVTALYSRPSISLWRCSSLSANPPTCTVTCSASGGFPQSRVHWAVDNGNLGDVLKEAGGASLRDSATGLWNVSQNITLNCTQPATINCTIGTSTSSPLTLCAHRPPPVDSMVVIASALVLLLVVIIIIIFTVRMRQRPQHQVEQGAEMQQLK